MSLYGERRYSIGPQILEKGIKVNRAKVEVIERLPPPISVKGVRSFLGHVGFYQRFIKDFLKLHIVCANYSRRNSSVISINHVLKCLDNSKSSWCQRPSLVPQIGVNHLR